MINFFWKKILYCHRQKQNLLLLSKHFATKYDVNILQAVNRFCMRDKKVWLDFIKNKESEKSLWKAKISLTIKLNRIPKEQQLVKRITYFLALMIHQVFILKTNHRCNQKIVVN